MPFNQFYIDGAWVDPVAPRLFDVINPATEEAFERISLGTAADVDKAVAAARAAFPSWSATSKEERLALLGKILACYKQRSGEIGEILSREMGAPLKFATSVQAKMGPAHFAETARVFKEFALEEPCGGGTVTYEPIGVCGLITPWNWPINQIACKVAPALAAGCTMVLKPSEIAPLSAHLLADILHEAGVPKGVFNLVDGDGPGVGVALSRHPGIDMVSFTGSTRAGIEVSKNAAETIKRVTLELGGKSPNVILDDADFQAAVAGGVMSMMSNTGQSCNAPSRMLVPADRHDEAAEIAKATALSIRIGNPADPDTRMGPLVSEAQFRKVQGLIEKGIAEGATLVTGGPGRPEGLNRGYFARATVFGNVRNDMTIAREEIFGPVLCILPYKDENEAVRIANDTVYGLAAYVQSGDAARARRVGAQIQAGSLHINTYQPDMALPFGGYKHSGLGREWGVHGLREFFQVKSYTG